jgi:parallel beta-helix repeat protein
MIFISIFLIFVSQIYQSVSAIQIQIILGEEYVVIDESTPGAKQSLNTVVYTLLEQGKKRIYILDGEYNLDGRINVFHSDIIIRGQSKEGTIVTQTTTGSSIESIRIQNTQNVEITNLTIDNSSGGAAVIGQDINYVKIENCIIYGPTNESAIIFYGKTVSNDFTAVDSEDLDNGNSISNNTVYSPLGNGHYRDGILFRKQKNGRVENNTLTGSRIAFYLCRDSSVSNNVIKDSQTNGIRHTVNGYNNVIKNNQIENTRASGISVDREDQTHVAKGYRATGIEISGNKITNSRYFGIEVANLKDSIIKDNEITNIDFSGIYLLQSDDLIVDNNYIMNVGLVTINGNVWSWNESLNAGIFLDNDVTYAKITSNTIENKDATVPNVPGGIRIYPNNENHHNQVNDNWIEGYFDYGTAMRTEEPINNIDSPNTILLYARTVPTNISVEPFMDYTVLNWDSMGDGFQYQIDIDGSIIENGSSTTYIHEGLNQGTTYYYRVRGIGGGWSDWINVKTLIQDGDGAEDDEEDDEEEEDEDEEEDEEEDNAEDENEDDEEDDGEDDDEDDAEDDEEDEEEDDAENDDENDDNEDDEDEDRNKNDENQDGNNGGQDESNRNNDNAGSGDELEKNQKDLPDVNPIEEPKEEAEAKPIEELKEEAEAKPIEEAKEEAEAKPIEEPKEEAEAKPIEEPKEEAEAKPIEEPKEEAEAKPIEGAKEEVEAKPIEGPKEGPKEEAEAKPIEEPKEEEVENINWWLILLIILLCIIVSRFLIQSKKKQKEVEDKDI